ncbi:MAG TPA: hypothetical protein VIH68_01960 [Bacteroidota bacterium]
MAAQPMSLKHFHIVFIILSILLAFGFGIWSVNSYGKSQDSTDLTLGIISLAVGVGLIFYGRMVYKKLKTL